MKKTRAPAPLIAADGPISKRNIVTISGLFK